MEKPRGVSIICVTYNHEKYISKALDGFLMQKTDFPVEILIHDDASTDHTADIIREYLKKNPGRITAVLQTENQYSKGVNIEQTFLIPQCKYRYTAMCDGDDYWTDPEKLQIQVDLLEKNPDIDICTHKARQIEGDEEKNAGYLAPSEKDRSFTVQEVILGGGGFVATSSIVYRSRIDEIIPDFRVKLDVDYTTQIDGSLRGGMLYLSRCMSVYRVNVEGSWMDRIYRNREKKAQMFETIIQMLLLLNTHTKRKYEEIINEVITDSEFAVYKARGNCKQMLNSKYRREFKKLPFKSRIKIRLGAAFPFLVKAQIRK